MMWELELGGVRFKLNPAAISAVRYRAEYGDSAANQFHDSAGRLETERVLLRTCHQMIPEPDRPALLDFARLARRDGDFFTKALEAHAALFEADPLEPDGRPTGSVIFDEYEILAIMAEAHIDLALIYELPILHLLSVVRRYAKRKDPNRASEHRLTDEEMFSMFPRRRR